MTVRTLQTSAAETVCSCRMLRRATRRMTRFYDRALKPAGLKLTQYTLLAYLADRDGRSITELADLLAMDRTTLTRNLRPLESAGWVKVGPGPNKRSRSVTITPAGKRLHARAEPIWLAAEISFRDLFGHDDAVALRDMLADVTTRMPAG